ncbi:SCO family protein [Diaphorobacter aerolatus]|uniref:Cytochrome C oxidase subunit I n=1 Tax=Diaphorobacter aerolatus TaxID=1288495 RepID=A0A7H0GHR7_9BURK|nr:hypothetical protein [Diaphorobacter aerolatus]QNP47833.1 hypothetical protein H9K75_17015 [Diaphorobacter aerolatus]
MSGSNSSDASFAHAASRPPEAAAAQSPLAFTVHSMPRAGEAMADAEARQMRTGRWKMLSVLLICAAPVIASYFTYYVVRPEGRRNFGELIQPQLAMPPQAMVTTLDGKNEPLDQFKGQWLLVSVAGAACEDACRENLYLQRQLRESLGKEKERVDRLWLVSDQATIPAEIAPGLKEAAVVRADPALIAQWLKPADGQALSDHLYVVDPMGHWMMRFPAKMDRKSASQAKRDLDRLLRASSSWDKAGRDEEIVKP